MFSQKELKEIHRRKQVVVARNDLLREECAEIWSGLGRRTWPIERRLNILGRVPPGLFLAASAGLEALRRQVVPEKKYLRPVFAAAGFVLNTLRPRPEDLRQLQEQREQA